MPHVFGILSVGDAPGASYKRAPKQLSINKSVHLARGHGKLLCDLFGSVVFGEGHKFQSRLV